MKPATNFQSSFPAHLLPAVPQAGNTPKTEASNAIQPKAFIWPVITDQDYKTTMDNFRLYRAEYNRKIAELNSETKIYNKAVAEYIQDNPRTEAKNILISLFLGKHNYKKNTHKAEYNNEVENFNDTHGMYFEKVLFQPLRLPTVEVFSNFVHAYAVELAVYVRIWKNTNKVTPTFLPKCHINPEKIINLKRNGEQSVDYTKRTIRSYRSRFEEAGVLTDKQFRGSEIPVSYLFNPGILAISDAFLSSDANAENQSFKESKRKKLQHEYNDSSTRSIKNESEKKGIVDSSERNASLFFNLKFYKTTNLQGGKVAPAHNAEKGKPGAKILNEMPNLGKVLEKVEAAATPESTVTSEPTDFEENRENRFELAAQLAAGQYDQYIPLHHRNLAQMIQDPNISDAEFLEIGKLDFMKTAAKLYLGNHPTAKSWGAGLKHIDRIINAKALNYKEKPKTKNELYTVIMSFRYRLNYALRKFKKMNWKGVWYPGVYFDPLRSLPTDVCFDYTRKVWTNLLKDKSKEAEKKRKDIMEARKRERQLAEKRAADREAKKNPKKATDPNEKLDHTIYRYLRKEINFTELTRFVTEYLPQKQQEQLGARLQELSLRRLIN